MDKSELVVDTPWGKLVTLKGLKILITGFTNDFDEINNTLVSIATRLNEIESTSTIINPNSKIQAIEGSLKSLEDDIAKFRENQSQFAQHMKETLQLFYTRLDELTIRGKDQ
ncbi:MAG: hypothetical protein ACW964_11160 [Candidatus Hodarchaeales archaeon]|jgi:hypothetical protein